MKDDDGFYLFGYLLELSEAYHRQADLPALRCGAAEEVGRNDG